jgi:hypothetical protein
LRYQSAKSPGQFPVRSFSSVSAEAIYFFTGGIRLIDTEGQQALDALF